MLELLPDRVWAKINKNGSVPANRSDLGPCWIWMGTTCGNARGGEGYGQWKYKGKKLLVHRSVYEVLVGPIPEGLELDHLCRNHLCCNPSHVEPVTGSVNVRRGLLPGIAAGRQLAKTHCPKGHEYNEANTIVGVNSSGGPNRKCRICNNASSARSRRYAG